jgi:predicted phosphodiesterase
VCLNIKSINKKIEKDEIYIHMLYDLHIGAETTNLDLIKKEIDLIAKDNNRYFVLGGDILDMAIVGSIASAYGSTPHEDIKKFMSLFDPIMDKCLVAIKGNHENRLNKSVGIDILGLILPSDIYAGDTALLNVNYNKRNNYSFFIFHGTGGGRTKGSKMNAAYRGKDIIVDADFYVSGHTHDTLYSKDKVLIQKDNHVTFKERRYLACGSYLEWGGYAESKMLPPGSLGSPIVKLFTNKDGKRDFSLLRL